MGDKPNGFDQLRRIFKIHQYRSKVIAEKKMKEEVEQMRLHSNIVPTAVAEMPSAIMPHDISALVQDHLAETTRLNLVTMNNNLYNQPPQLYTPPNEAPQIVITSYSIHYTKLYDQMALISYVEFLKFISTEAK